MPVVFCGVPVLDSSVMSCLGCSVLLCDMLDILPFMVVLFDSMFSIVYWTK